MNATLPPTHHSRNAPSTHALMILAAALAEHRAHEAAEAKAQATRDLDAERLAMAFGAPVEGVTLEMAGVQ